MLFQHEPYYLGSVLGPLIVENAYAILDEADEAPGEPC